MKLVKAMRCLTSSARGQYPRYLYNNRAYAKYPDLRLRQTNSNITGTSARYCAWSL
ncbi:hypothetical protein [Vibrio phage BUCT194]|uniref:Uncharacterized protein n=1 Tax=Vibrio phage BUCT194 TaxID=2859072 RepID=A0AAE8XFK3_9CAUD|nr:hypothetical protein PP741_gp049 [Vibrio phage BUCT194]UAW01176.1 hypothetical protein [Vibrio phage BUCT194]